jgi:hypothetical protein
MIRIGMSKIEFESWKKEWFLRVPKCKDFACCHELTTCAIKPLCGCGSIYSTYHSQECSTECLEVTCADCFNKYDCKRTGERFMNYKGKDLTIDCSPNNDRADCDNCPNPCRDIDKCEFCTCPMECAFYVRK